MRQTFNCFGLMHCTVLVLQLGLGLGLEIVKQGQGIGQGSLLCVQGITELLRAILLLFLQYCHYVAGLVGIGLSRLFSASELEDKIVGEDTELANSMGLFLQKTNIIRDYLEDNVEGREFWPKEVFTQPFPFMICFLKKNVISALYCVSQKKRAPTNGVPFNELCLKKQRLYLYDLTSLCYHLLKRGSI